jgi:hypothetical protein
MVFKLNASHRITIVCPCSAFYLSSSCFPSLCFGYPNECRCPLFFTRERLQALRYGMFSLFSFCSVFVPTLLQSCWPHPRLQHLSRHRLLLVIDSCSLSSTLTCHVFRSYLPCFFVVITQTTLIFDSGTPAGIHVP